MEVLQEAGVRNICIYPVKSGGRLELQQARITTMGLETPGGIADRQWMVVRAQPNQEGLFPYVTQRDPKMSKMALMKPELMKDGKTLLLSWNGNDNIQLELDRTSGLVLPIRIWDYVGRGIDQGDRMAEWVSYHLGISARLVRADGQRPVRQNYVENPYTMRWPDGYPIHYFGIASVEDLSRRAGRDIPWQRFRPNIVLEGMPAYYENQIYAGYLAGVPFINSKPCDRCQIPMFDQQTGEITDLKPLTLLKEFRNWRNRDGEVKQIFGENMIVQGEGVLQVGDKFLVISHRTPPLDIFGPTKRSPTA